MEFSIKDFFSKCDQIRRKLWIWSHLLKKFLMENFIFCAIFKMKDSSVQTKKVSVRKLAFMYLCCRLQVAIFSMILDFTHMEFFYRWD